jgi:hypothetical protein
VAVEEKLDAAEPKIEDRHTVKEKGPGLTAKNEGNWNLIGALARGRSLLYRCQTKSWGWKLVSATKTETEKSMRGQKRKKLWPTTWEGTESRLKSLSQKTHHPAGEGEQREKWGAQTRCKNWFSIEIHTRL